MSAPSIHHHLSFCPSTTTTTPPFRPLPLPPLCLSDRAVASVLQGGCPGEQYRGEEALGMHSQHYATRATNLREFFCFLFVFSFKCVLWVFLFYLFFCSGSSSLTLLISWSSIRRCGWGMCVSNKSCRFFLFDSNVSTNVSDARTKSFLFVCFTARLSWTRAVFVFF